MKFTFSFLSLTQVANFISKIRTSTMMLEIMRSVDLSFVLDFHMVSHIFIECLLLEQYRACLRRRYGLNLNLRRILYKPPLRFTLI